MYKKENISNSENDFADVIDIKRILILMFQSKWVFVVLIAVFCAVAIAFNFLDSPKYNSSFSVYYKKITDNSNSETYKYSHNDKLDNDYWTKVMRSQNFTDKIRDISSLNIASDNFNVSQKKDNDNIFNISLVLSRKENIEAATYAYVDALNSIEKENNAKRLSSFLTYIKEQLLENTRKLNEINDQIAKSNISLNIGQISDRDQLKVAYNKYKQKLNDLTIALATINTEKISTRKEFDYQQDTLFYESSFSEPLKVQLMNLKIDLAKAFTKYKKAHPVILGIKDNIKQVEDMLRKGVDENVEIKNLSANPLKRDLYSSLTKILIKEAALKTEIVATRKIVDGLNNQLNNDSDNIFNLFLKKEKYYSTISVLNKRIIDTENFLQSETNNFILVNSPDIPLSKANKSLAFLLCVAVFLAICAGAAYVIAFDFIDNRLRLISDIDNKFGLPVLGVLSHRKKNNSLKSVCALDANKLDELFYRELTQVRINVNQLVEKDFKTYSVISPSRREGKTFFSYLFSHELARSGDKVLIIDLDTYVPRLSKCMNLDKNLGLQDYLLDEKVQFEDCVNNTKNSNIDILACGQNEFDNQIFYDNIRFDSLLKEAAANYDRVIIDTPGLLFFPEIVSFVKRVDYVVFVARMHKTTRNSLKALLKKVGKLPLEMLGIVVTDNRQSPFDNEYSYEYDYDYKYGKE